MRASAMPSGRQPARARDRAIDIERIVEGRRVRFTTRLDAESERFEAELLARQRELATDDDRAAGIAFGNGSPLELTLQQRHAWLAHTDAEFRLLQMSDAAGRAAMQAVAYVERPRLFPAAGDAFVRKLWRATSPEDEAVGLRALRLSCEADGELATLRLQPRRLHATALRDFEQRARRAGFALAEPESITRTLVLDLCESEEALLASFSSKTRQKLRARERSAIEIRPLDDATYLDACKAAALASIARTGGGGSRTEWGPMLALARERPDLVRVLGLFDRTRPGELLAFVCGQRHGAVAEYVSAGSLDDETLRKLPFNYFLIWELTRWARTHGARHLDLGGVTDGGADDPLAGISRFKRHLTRRELEVGREMVAMLRPGRAWAVRAVRTLAQRFGEERLRPARR